MDVAKAKRSIVRSQTTKLINKIENKFTEGNLNEDDIEQYFAELELKEKELNSLDNEIQVSIKVEELEPEVIKCDEYNTALVVWKSKLKRARIRLENRTTPNLTVTNTSNNSGERTVVKEVEAMHINLPKLQIEKFEGDVSDFQRFWDQFESAIHKNTDLTNVDKFNYLRSYLKGVASDSIKGFSLTNSNYEAAVETLKERFGKKTVIINSHLNKLLNLTPVKRSSDIFALRKLFDNCQTEIRNLEALGIKDEYYSTLLCPILIKLLPSDIVLEIAKKYGSDEEWKVSEILQILKVEVESREKATALISKNQNLEPFSHTGNKPEFHNANKINKNRTPTASGLLNETTKRKNKCFYCDSDKHILPDCKEFKSKHISERREFLSKRGCCFVCFFRGHLANTCKSNIRCKICARRHYDIMCPENKTEKVVETESTALSNKTCNQEVLMQTLTVCLINKNKEIQIRALIDTGSQKSYLTKGTINQIEYTPIGQENLNHSLFGGLQQTNKHKKYRIYLSSLDKNYYCNFEVYDQDKICAEIPKIGNGPWMREAKNQKIYFSDYENIKGSKKENKDIHLLIGADVCGKLFTGNIRNLTSGLVAIETRLGWTLMGKTNEARRSDSTKVVLSLHVANAEVSELWKLDTLGILDPGQKESRQEIEKAAEEHFNRNIRIVEDGRYEVALPWIHGHPPLPSCRNVAERRLKNCVESLKKSERLEDYEAVFQEWLQEKIIEEVSLSDDIENDHYLPHRAVFKENSTTKIRPVFDGSCKIKGFPSINDCLEKGPNLVELIPSIINRFRLKSIGVISDIRKAFLQIQLNQFDRPFLKFLWWEKGDPKKLKIFQHRRVVFGLTCSPYLLGATLQYHLKHAPEEFKPTAEKLLDSFYIDNCVTSVDNEKELETFINESKALLSTAQFDLRGWEHTSVCPKLENTDTADKDNVPVLGLSWDLNKDTLSIDLREDKSDQEILTKRKILSLTHKVFDPIGYTSPFTLLPKIMLQECWQLKISWDAELPSTIKKKFEKWKNQLTDLRNIEIPRCLGIFTLPQNLSLHVFCDASKLAYATCIFLRSKDQNSISCQLVQARTRVSPLKSITIPRLELLACTIGARLAKSVKTDLRMPDLATFFWSDSNNALYWIKKNDQWAPFVYNRVQEIRKLTNPEDWHYVPGSLNPADLPSRGCSAEYLKKTRWWEGPQWLKESQETWPNDTMEPDFEIINSEKRKTVVTATNTEMKTIEFFENSNSFKRMVRITGWIYRFFRNLKSASSDRNLEKQLNVDEIKNAELALLKYVQKKCLSNEKKSYYTSLHTVIDDYGIIRIRTRISSRKDLETFKYPVVLPSDHNVTHSLISDKHEELSHAGTQIVMSVLREQYWIIRCRKTVQRVIKKCIKCRRFNSQPIEVPSAPLPEDRVREALVFEVIGTDLCGPLFLKDGSKCWVVIFTCAVFRAIHVELVTSLSSDSFLLAFRRFIARRGRPTTVFSDNATNMTRSSADLKSIDFEKIKEFATIKKIRWKFNPPSAPWWGGFFERMIGMLKTILRKVLGKASLRYEELYTILCDAESVINSRPLTYVSEDIEDLVPLTPAMFLSEIRESGVPDFDLIDASKMRKRFAYRQKVREDLRKRFRIEYLAQLRDFAKKKKETHLKIGEVVLLGDDNTKRINWPMGRIEEIYPGKDNKIRVVRVKTQSGSYLRPVRRIYPLEVRDSDKELLTQSMNITPSADDRS